jgi:hypothetical protein
MTTAQALAETLAVVNHIERWGFLVVAEENGYSVRRDVSRQVACFALNADGTFRWGWVETRNGNGRTDYRTDLGHTFEQYLNALTRRHRRTR